MRLAAVIGADVEGAVLASEEPLSFWGGYDPATGEIIDRRHPLSGFRAGGTILVVPGTRGSSTTTAVLLEAVRAGTAPAAIVADRADPFVSLASIVAEELYGQRLPLFVGDAATLARVRAAARARISASGEVVLGP